VGGAMKLSNTRIAGVVVAEAAPYEDDRGAFTRLFCQQELALLLDGRGVVQINHSRTARRGAVRGMHYQVGRHAEMKLIRCLRGRVWDVAVDLRAGSPTFLQWHAEELTPVNGRMLVVPEGCAHGFQALDADSELLYLHTAAYCAKAESGMHCQDPKAAITWPLPVIALSPRDSAHPRLDASFRGVSITA
jgi:dTDP-4-dehydrorhamnose 3,5-epimerase